MRQLARASLKSEAILRPRPCQARKRGEHHELREKLMSCGIWPMACGFLRPAAAGCFERRRAQAAGVGPSQRQAIRVRSAALQVVRPTPGISCRGRGSRADAGFISSLLCGHTKRQRLHRGLRFILGNPVGEHPRQVGDLGDPATVFLSLEFNLERRAASLAARGESHGHE